MPNRPAVIVFDVNETLSDLAPMAGRFADVGAPRQLAPQWFAMLLRDGFARMVAGGPEKFATLGRGALRTLLSDLTLDRDLDSAVDYVMEGFMALSVHPDVPEGVRALRAAGYRLVTLTNGAVAVAEGLFDRAGIRGEFEALLSVEDAATWKPAARAYEYAAEQCGVELDNMLLVAVHPWDIHGAAQAGVGTAWINRTQAPYPDFFTQPDHAVAALTDLTGTLK